MKVLDLFSGIGGFSLGLEKAGMETVAFCEIDPHCSKVLEKHWPRVDNFRDIKQLTGKYLNGVVDLICGGYPCTGHSVAGQKKGFKDERSNLWLEYLRLIKEIKPRYCIIENSPNLRSTGMGQLLKDVHAVGYNAEWSIISAYSIGSPHQRERLFIVLWRGDVPYCNPFRLWQADPQKKKISSRWWSERLFKRSPLFKQASKIESRVLQFDDGISQELSENEIKIKMLGNSLLPQIPELIGRALMEHERSLSCQD